MLKKLLWLVVLLIVAAAAVFLYGYRAYQTTLSQPLIPANNGVISVPRGMTFTALLDKLQAEYGLKATWPGKILIRQYPQLADIKAGDYAVTANMTLEPLLNHIRDGKVLVYHFQLIDGKTFADLMAALDSAPYVKHTLSGKTPSEIAQTLGINGSPEGWFLPQTYDYHRGMTDVEILTRLHQAMQDTLQNAWQQRAPNLPLKTPYDALILASIIEKETAVPEEHTQIAGVFIRRLEKGMRLQTDPTIIYGLNAFGHPLTRKDLATPNPYNSYLNHGLPPTPIAMPSAAAITAALHPAPGNALYFVANGRGGHTFSATYQAHQKAVAAYRKLEKK